MRETRTYGSVRGAPSNGRPYRDSGRFRGSGNSEQVEPLAWLTDVLERMISGRTRVRKLKRLLPWAWKAEYSAATGDV